MSSFAARSASSTIARRREELSACQALAERHPDRTVVFFAVGFETTAPANAMAVWQARRRGVRNFAVLVSHVRVPPAMAAILSAPENRVQGFLAAGHVPQFDLAGSRIREGGGAAGSKGLPIRAEGQ